MNIDGSDCLPPSDALEKHGFLWYPRHISPVSYPENCNDVYFQIEDKSYWFKHRNQCIVELIKLWKPQGAIYDIGGGNGYNAISLQAEGYATVVVEPGSGALNAVNRGVRQVIKSTLLDANFHDNSLPACAAFDVIEHLEDDLAFLTLAHKKIIPGGRFYCTVPAHQFLWSKEDVAAGHYRRYSKKSLASIFLQSGFQIEFMTFIFSWLPLPIFAARTIPYRLCCKTGPSFNTDSVVQDHRLPKLLSFIVNRVHKWELRKLQRSKALFFGASLLCVARAR